MQIELLTTVKQRVVGRVSPLNEIGGAARPTSIGLEENGSIVAIWRIPQGAAVALPDQAAEELLRLGYAAPFQG